MNNYDDLFTANGEKKESIMSCHTAIRMND